MRVIQVLTTLSFGDAVGNDTVALQNVLDEMGFNSSIYAENIDPRLKKNNVEYIDKIGNLKDEDVIIYHLSTGTDLNYWIKKQKCRKIMIYHNITPPYFFREYNKGSQLLCEMGYEQVKLLNDTFDVIYADSEYNMQELRKMGYKCDIKVLPILIPFEDYGKVPNRKVISKYDTKDCVNIVFVGRIAPNKKQENVIKTFYEYHKNYNINSKLFLVGSYSGLENYYQRLVDYYQALGLTNDDVIFTGHIKFDEILAYYKIADIFLCMSEHEGFCVPLVEAMCFNVPIIARDTSAIGYTLENSGVLLKDNSLLEYAGMINYLIENKEFRERVVERQRERLKEYSNKKVIGLFKNYLKEFLGNI